MKRTMMGLCVAAAFGFVASLGAQSTTSSTATSDKDVTVTGCLERGASGNYMLANAKKESGMPGTSTSTGTTGTSGTSATGTTSGASGMSARGTETWTLEGSSSDLEKHVGHKIEVTGKEISSSSSSATGATTGTTGTTATGTTGTSSSMASQKLDVKSVKMISSSCS